MIDPLAAHRAALEDCRLPESMPSPWLRRKQRHPFAFGVVLAVSRPALAWRRDEVLNPNAPRLRCALPHANKWRHFDDEWVFYLYRLFTASAFEHRPNPGVEVPVR